MRRPSSTTLTKTGIAASILVLAAVWYQWIVNDATWRERLTGLVSMRMAQLDLLIATALVLTVAFALAVTRAGYSRLGKRLVAIIFSAMMTFVLLELVFMFVPRSHNVGFTLASQLWREDYWHPINTLGYRDREHREIPGKQLVFAIGDSFTAGGGLRDVRSRFANQLNDLRPDLNVLNLGQNGASCGGEYRRLLEHPLKPDTVILQYYPNDIEGAARREGFEMPKFSPYEDIASVTIRSLVRKSYLANYVYWLFPHTDSLAYANYYKSAANNEQVVRRHLDEISKFCDYRDQHGIALIAVVFPMLNDFETSRTLVTRVMAHLNEQQVPVIDVEELVRAMTPDERTVNSHDAHASVRVNRLVAEALAKRLPR